MDRLALLNAVRALHDPNGDHLSALAELLALRFQGQQGAPPPAEPEGAPVGGPVGGLTRGGGPEDHGARALGNWQSDLAYDLMGRAGQRIPSTVTGRVVRISGQPGGNPQFAGYGITVAVPGRGQVFFKHLGSTPLEVGDRVRPGMLIGTLDPSTRGGPHLHLGATNRSFLDQLMRLYTRRR